MDAITCQACHRMFAWREDLAGKTVRCKCGQQLEIPATPSSSDEGASPLDAVLASAVSAGSNRDECPSCGAPLGVQTAICTACGFNRITGQQMTTNIHGRAVADTAMPGDRTSADSGSRSSRSAPAWVGKVKTVILLGAVVAAGIGASFGWRGWYAVDKVSVRHGFVLLAANTDDRYLALSKPTDGELWEVSVTGPVSLFEKHGGCRIVDDKLIRFDRNKFTLRKSGTSVPALAVVTLEYPGHEKLVLIASNSTHSGGELAAEVKRDRSVFFIRGFGKIIERTGTITMHTSDLSPVKAQSLSARQYVEADRAAKGLPENEEAVMFGTMKLQQNQQSFWRLTVPANGSIARATLAERPTWLRYNRTIRVLFDRSQISGDTATLYVGDHAIDTIALRD